MKTLPILQVNSLYDTRYRLFSLAGWFSNDTVKRAQQLLTDGRYLQLDANLRYFYERYQNILEERNPDGSWTDVVRSSDEGRLIQALSGVEVDVARETIANAVGW